MRKTFALVAVAVVSLLGTTSTAAPAPVDVYVIGLHSATGYGIYAAPALDVGNIALHVVGVSGMTLMPLPQISVLDSPFVGGPLGANLMITSIEGQNLLPQPSGGFDYIHLANLIYSSVPVIYSGDDVFGYTVLNQALTEPIPYRLYFEDHNHQIVLVDEWLPEAEISALLGIGLGALLLIRRAA